MGLLEPSSLRGSALGTSPPVKHQDSDCVLIEYNYSVATLIELCLQ